MSLTVGIYRGSFDPPHFGHLETISCALNNGVDKVIVVYKDKNPLKPERSCDKTRYLLLVKLFEGFEEVEISDSFYKHTLQAQIDNSTVAKVRLIIGFDLLNTRFRAVSNPEKVDCLAIPRTQFSVESIPPKWNGLTVEAASSYGLVERGTSSSTLRRYLSQNQLIEVSKALGTKVLLEILNQEFYSIPLSKEIKKLVTDYSIDLCLGGLSENLVLKVLSTSGKPLYIVKVFEKSADFERELSGYNTISRLQLQLVRVPKIYYAAQNTIIMDFVEGKTLAELMGTNLDGVRLCAKANQELHNAQMASFTTIPEEILSIGCRVANLCLVNGNLIISKWNGLLKAFYANPGKTSVVHGDPNHFNWIVDTDRGVVTYIDLSAFSECGFAMKEYFESQLCFWTAAKRVGGIPKSRLEKIRSVYEESYFEDFNRGAATGPAKALFKAYWILRIIESLIINNKSFEKELIDFLNISEGNDD